jgi:hydroxymethylbilane synthase
VTISALVCASRRSALALTQTRTVAALLARRGVATTILPLNTAGDRERDKPIVELATVNVFVGELEAALRDGRADYAVHSCKDLPSELSPDMQLAAISAREDARDAFCSETYDDFGSLPPGAIVGTSSPRRRAQLQALRPDLDYRDLRGNVDTRLKKLREGQYDAIVLAMAGLLRLGARAKHTVPFSCDEIVPAVGQGALAIEARADRDAVARELRAAINDGGAEWCVRAERAALAFLRAGCSAPIGIHVGIDRGRAFGLGARLLDGGSLVRARLSRAVDGGAPERFGRDLAGRLQTPPLAVLPRTRDGRSRIAERLRASGLDVLELRAGDEWPDPAERIPDMLVFPSSGSVAAAAPYLQRLAALPRPWVAAMGPSSGRAAAAAGFAPDAICDEASVDALVRLVRERAGRP